MKTYKGVGSKMFMTFIKAHQLVQKLGRRAHIMVPHMPFIKKKKSSPVCVTSISFYKEKSV